MRKFLVLNNFLSLLFVFRAHHLTALAKRTEYPAYGVTGPNPLHEQPYETVRFEI